MNARKYQFKFWNQSRWLKLFYHNHEVYEGFKDDNEAQHSNDPNKYSILYKLDDRLKYDGVFEFHLEYQTYIVHWKQDINPVTLDEKDYYKVPGLFVYPSTVSVNNFRGLALSTLKDGDVKNAFLDGNPGEEYWYYAVGMHSYTYNNWYKRGIPGASGAEKSVALWVRVSNSFCFYTINFSQKKINFWLYIIFIVLIS